MNTAEGSAPGRRVQRFAWLAGSQLVSRTLAFVTLVVLARLLSLDDYGAYVVLAALLAAATLAWNPTVVQSAATKVGVGARQRDWDMHLVRWGVAGLVAVAPFAWLTAGWQAVAAVAFASGAETIMMRSVPQLLVTGQQRRLAFGTTSSQVVRFGAVLALAAMGVLSPVSALAAHGVGFLAGAAAQGRAFSGGTQRMERLGSELTVEALRWIESYGPIVGVAVFVGFSTAAGFDLILKLAIALSEVLAAVGVIILPDMVGGGARVPDAIGRGLRIPVPGAVVLAVGYAVGAVPIMRTLTGQPIELGLVPLALAFVLLAAPWAGVSRTALLAGNGARWLVPSQVASASWTLLGGFLAPIGVIWPAVATAAAHVSSGVIRFLGLRRLQLLPRARDVLSAERIRTDLVVLGRALAGRRGASGTPPRQDP